MATLQVYVHCFEDFEPPSPDSFTRDAVVFDLPFNHEQPVTGHDQVVIALVEAGREAICCCAWYTALDGWLVLVMLQARPQVQDMELPMTSDAVRIWRSPTSEHVELAFEECHVIGNQRIQLNGACLRPRPAGIDVQSAVVPA